MNINLGDGHFSGTFQGKDVNTGKRVKLSFNAGGGYIQVKIDGVERPRARDDRDDRKKSSKTRGNVEDDVPYVTAKPVETSLLDDSVEESVAAETTAGSVALGVKNMKFEQDSDDTSSEGYQPAQGLSQESYGMIMRRTTRSSRSRDGGRY